MRTIEPKRGNLQRAVLGLLLFSLAPLQAEVLGFRMDGDGHFPDTNPPLSWSTTKNVAWKTPMPDWSNASPVLLAERSMLLALSEPDQILAVHSETGKILWKQSTGDLTGEEVSAHEDNGRTSATPVTDGESVYAVFGSGVVAAYSLDGKRQWARRVKAPEHRWGTSASPVLGGGRLIVQLVDLIALNQETGEEVWRQASEPKWGSPVVTQIAGVDVVITTAGDVFRASDGHRLAESIGKLEFATPVVQDGVVYFIEKKATAVRLPKTLDGAFEQLWIARVEGSRHYASSLIHEGLIYAVSREQTFSILDATSGELVHQRQLDLDPEAGANSAYPSISLAGDKLYLSAENGTTVVLSPGREYKELARNSVEGFRTTPIFIGNRMYLRAFDHMYCFEQEPATATSS